MLSAPILLNAKRSGHRPWVVVTAYDAPTASLLERSGVDWVLVGDSVATVLLGYHTTAEVTLSEMLHHVRAVRRGLRTKALIADLPALGLAGGAEEAVRSAAQLQEAGADAVKIEMGTYAIEAARRCVERGIEVVGHVGLTPQQLVAGEKPQVRGRRAEEALAIYRQAMEFERAGACAIVLECVPSELAGAITRKSGIPTIGIGAGADCDGQVLVYHDLVGLVHAINPKFIKRYADLETAAASAVTQFAAEVRERSFPSAQQAYTMDAADLEAFRQALSTAEVSR